jgi:hypothetical protein
MTAQDENNHEVEQDSRLERILQTVKSIDRNVEEIREKLTERFDKPSCQDWEIDEFFNGKDY